MKYKKILLIFFLIFDKIVRIRIQQAKLLGHLFVGPEPGTLLAISLFVYLSWNEFHL